MRITLVNMPWQAVTWPSLAISTLDTLLTGLGHEVTQLYENLRFVEQTVRPDSGVDPADYFVLSDEGHNYGAGEWVFTSALYRPDWREEEFTAYLASVGFAHIDMALALHRLAPEFIDRAAERVLATEPDLVGCTTTFEQNVASLALARRLKQLRPGLPIAFGGGNCDEAMGAALHRHFPAVDYVVRGEGERPLTELLEALAGDRPLGSVTGLCWRDDAGRHVENPYVPVMTPAPAIPSPNLRPFFDQVHGSPARPWIDEIYVRLETARGCWWGEKRHCTFCGLNDATIGYRSKSPERAWEEISSAVGEFDVLSIMFNDNILDPAYLTTLLPRLAATGWDLRIFYEMKSNAKPEELAMLAAAGVVSVQPGIESLASGPLALMDKGATGAAQVRALRLFREYGIFPSWNYLFGFPGEDWARDYRNVLDQIPALVHLPPPSLVNRITLDRFSPLSTRPELGIAGPHRPAPWYPIVYDLPEHEVADMAFLFRCEPHGIDDATAASLVAAGDAWRESYPQSTLTQRVTESSVVLTDRRVGWPERDHVLEGLPAAAYLTLARQLTVAALRAALRAGGHDLADGAADGELQELLLSWRRDGLVYEDDGTWVALAVPFTARQRSTWEERRDFIAA